MNRISLFAVMLSAFLLIACVTADPDYNDYPECVKWEQRYVSLSFASVKKMDSVLFYLDSTHLCTPSDDFKKNRGQPGYQGEYIEYTAYCNNEFCDSISTEQNFVPVYVYGCVVGSLCDSVESPLINMRMEIFSGENVETYRIKDNEYINSLYRGPLSFDFYKQYRIFRESDLSMVKRLDRGLVSIVDGKRHLSSSNYEEEHCQDGFCVERNYYLPFCVDAKYEGRLFPRACYGGYEHDYWHVNRCDKLTPAGECVWSH